MPKPAADRPTRVERKRLETRTKIIAATADLLQTRALDDLTIAEITEAADVGHGTFYLHFKTKHDVMVPIFQEKTKQWDIAAHKAKEAGDNPAVAVAHSTRFIAHRILEDPLCRWFLRDSGFPVDELSEAVGAFLARDIRLGIEAGQFQVSDLDFTVRYLIGGAVANIIALFDAENADDQVDLIAEFMLRTLGLPGAEAQALARHPLEAG